MEVNDRLFGLWRARTENQLRMVAASFAAHLDPHGDLFNEPLDAIDIVAMVAPLFRSEQVDRLPDDERDARMAAIANIAHQQRIDFERHWAFDQPGSMCHAHCPFCHYQACLTVALDTLYANS